MGDLNQANKNKRKIKAMSKPQGLLTLDELKTRVTNDEIETIVAVFPDLYGRLIGKRFSANHFLNSIVEQGTHSCDYLFTVDMEMEPVGGYKFANWEKGYGDFHVVPDMKTLRIADWLEKSAFVVCDVVDEESHSMVPIAPRSLLKQQIERAAAMGFTAFAGSELEYYLFEDSYRDAAAKGYANLESVGWYLEDYHTLQATREEPFNAAVRRHLERSGVPVECTKGEWGIGQHELNVRYAEVLAMADNHAIYKQCLKEVADKQEMSVTFMAKFSEEQAGSSSHVHLSLWKGDDNAFHGSESLGAGWTCSDEFRWFLGGWLKHVPELMVFFASTVNSYKRFQSGSWAPTHIAWCRDNRTACFRVVGSGPSLRIECRLPGADCNPYLAYAAAMAAGLDGIENKIEPPEIFEGDVYTADGLAHVPPTLRDATDLFEKSELAQKTFGKDVVEHYTHFFRTEQRAYDIAVTDWERKRYFERI